MKSYSKILKFALAVFYFNRISALPSSAVCSASGTPGSNSNLLLLQQNPQPLTNCEAASKPQRLQSFTPGNYSSMPPAFQQPMSSMVVPPQMTVQPPVAFVPVAPIQPAPYTPQTYSPNSVMPSAPMPEKDNSSPACEITTTKTTCELPAEEKPAQQSPPPSSVFTSTPQQPSYGNMMPPMQVPQPVQYVQPVTTVVPTPIQPTYVAPPMQGIEYSNTPSVIQPGKPEPSFTQATVIPIEIQPVSSQPTAPYAEAPCSLGANPTGPFGPSQQTPTLAESPCYLGSRPISPSGPSQQASPYPETACSMASRLTGPSGPSTYPETPCSMASKPQLSINPPIQPVTLLEVSSPSNVPRSGRQSLGDISACLPPVGSSKSKCEQQATTTSIPPNTTSPLATLYTACDAPGQTVQIGDTEYWTAANFRKGNSCGCVQ